MVLINSNDADVTTKNVTYWLYYYGILFKRINYSDDISIQDFKLSNQTISFSLVLNEKIHSSDISFFWYRRGVNVAK